MLLRSPATDFANNQPVGRIMLHRFLRQPQPPKPTRFLLMVENVIDQFEMLSSDPQLPLCASSEEDDDN
jgi:hypothetical protein